MLCHLASECMFCLPLYLLAIRRPIPYLRQPTIYTWEKDKLAIHFGKKPDISVTLHLHRITIAVHSEKHLKSSEIITDIVMVERGTADGTDYFRSLHLLRTLYNTPHGDPEFC